MQYGVNWVSGSLVFAFLVAQSGPALAEVQCPTTTDANNETLHLYGFDVGQLSQEREILIGTIDFYGGLALAAAVSQVNPPQGQQAQCAIYMMTDHLNNVLAMLPKANNHFCLKFGTGGEHVEVLTGDYVFDSSSTCNGWAMHAFNYGARELRVYLNNGGSHVHGGFGVDRFYGNGAYDDLDDGPGPSWGLCQGDEGDDYIYGGEGSGTIISGGPGNDALFDAGGVGDYLYGLSGNECCMGESGGGFNVFDAGSGAGSTNDRCDEPQPGKVGCESYSVLCTAASSKGICFPTF